MSAVKAPFITPVARQVPYDNTVSGLTADDTNTAIDQAYAQAANASRGTTTCGFDGSASAGRYLEFFANNPSNNNPLIMPEASDLIAISISSSANSTGTVTIYRNGVSVATISLAATRKNTVSGLSIPFVPLDELSAAVTSGSITRPTLFLNIRTTP